MQDIMISRKNRIISFISISLWMSILINTDSYYSNYLFIGLFSLVCLLVVIKEKFDNRKNKITLVFSSILSFFVAISNYSIFYSNIEAAVSLLIVFVSGIVVFYIALMGFFLLLNRINMIIYGNRSFVKHINSKRIFIISFLFIVFVDLVVLFFSQYPGELTIDSINQITQIITDNYSNNNPYWHTMLIKAFFDFGYHLFGDANAAVATYLVFQVVALALIESYANMTLYQLGCKIIFNVLFCLFFGLVPYNYLYSITMWKDILFGGTVLLFIVCFVRLLTKTGNVLLNYILFIISDFGFCLLRSNGWYAFVATTLIFSLFLHKNNKIIITIMLFSLCCSYIMIHPLLDRLDMPQPDLVESLSIPLQQVSRVIVDDNDLTEDELNLLNKVVEVGKIEDTYLNYISDPIKKLVRDSDNLNYLSNNIDEFFCLYIKLGLRHPITYIFAFVDQTKGYYNSGYDYMICAKGVQENKYGIKRIEKSALLTQFVYNHYDSYYNLPFLNPFISIGSHVWLVICCLYIGIIDNNKYISMLTVPLLAIILSLLIATPVYSEFRYAYSVFTSIYFVGMIVIYFGKESQNSFIHTYKN